MDLRQMGEPFEKKFTQFSEDDIKKVTKHLSQMAKAEEITKTFLNFVILLTFEEVEKKDFSLVPSKYIEFVNRDENIDFDEKMTSLANRICRIAKSRRTIKK